MNISIDEQLIHTTIRIISVIDDKTISTGTGFFFRYDFENMNIPVIVTNKHVVKDARKIILKFSTSLEEKFTPGKQQTVDIAVNMSTFIMHPDNDVDLCLIPIEHILNQKFEQNLYMIFLTKENIIANDYIQSSISNIEDITLIGYPDGIIDEYNNLPIVRKGITATSLKYDFNNKKEFLIDSAIFGGSSGSPVFIFNQGSYSIGNTLYAGDRLLLIGIVYAVTQHIVNGQLKIIQVPSANVPITETYIPNNLGVVIKSERILDFEKILSTLVKK